MWPEWIAVITLLLSPLTFCREYLPADCGIHFFKIVCQFSTTVKGTEALCAAGTPMRKRLPSAVTSPLIKPGGNWNSGLGAPAFKYRLGAGVD
jgi:hypothetical protein